MNYVEIFQAAEGELDEASAVLNAVTTTDAGLRDKKWLSDYHVARAQVYATMAVAARPQPDFGVL